MNIHFVCTGNVYRSRMAEAYLKSFHLPDMHVSSSGISASHNSNGPISWYAMRIMFNERLHTLVKPYWNQTTPELLSKADLVIFMMPIHHQFSKENFGFSGDNYEIWDIEDVDDMGEVPGEGIDRELQIIRITEKTYSRIKEKVDNLVNQYTNNPVNE